MNISEIVPSRLYSWVYNPDAEKWSESHMKKGGRGGLAPNPLFGRVTVRTTKAGQAATVEMYVTASQKKAAKFGQTYTPDPNYTPRMEQTEFPCVYRSLSSGDFQVMIMEPRTTSKAYYVDGRLATPEEVATIKTYLKARSERDPAKVHVEFPYATNLTNLTVDELPETVDED